MMKKLGLLGKNISHSKSKQMYEEILNTDVDYSLFDYDEPNEIPNLDEFFKKVEGLSITAPYKKHFINLVSISDNVKKLGGINCIKKLDGKYYGTNTDYLAVKELLPKFNCKSIVLLGNGTMSKITMKALDELNLSCEHFFRSKDGNISELDLSSFKKCLIINSCSRDFIFKGKTSNDSIFWDYNYNNPNQEKLILNSQYSDGLSLLRLQALYALKFWSND
jgi:shikimate dehydrogenase